MKLKFVITLLSICIFASIFIQSCSKTSVESHRPIIAVSIPPQESLLRQIAGDSVKIVTLLKADSNPETFEISVNDMRSIHSADAYLAIGNLPFETTLLQRIASVRPDMKVINTSDSIRLIYGTHSHGDHTHTVADPHTWSSVRNLRMIASSMLDALIEIDPENSDYYIENHRRLDNRLDSIDAAIRSKLDGYQGSSFLVWHPFLSYFARDYGLNQLVIGEENKELSVKNLRNRISAAENDSVTAMFIQASLDSKQASNIADQINADPVEINPLSADWEDQFNIITDAITSKNSH